MTMNWFDINKSLAFLGIFWHFLAFLAFFKVFELIISLNWLINTLELLLSAPGPYPGSGPGASSATGAGPAPLGHEPCAESRIECQEVTDKAIN